MTEQRIPLAAIDSGEKYVNDRGGARAPAFTDIGALGLLTHCRQAMLMHDRPDCVKLRAALYPHPQPIGLRQWGRLCRRGFDAVLNDAHPPLIDIFFTAIDGSQRDPLVSHRCLPRASGRRSETELDRQSI